jgi:plasmid maintenance system antidote protein VapI
METITTVAIADRLKLLINKESRYAVAKFLGVTSQTVTNWYDRGTVMDDATAVKAAYALGIDPRSAIAWLQLERVKKKGDDNLSSMWRHIAEQIAA